jgi:outer membrane protein assembly factor BamD
MLKLSRAAIVLLACASVVPLAGCATTKGKGDTAYVARDVNTLYAAAKRTMDQGDYSQAAKLFDEVERQHPYSVWARRAQLMSAFNYYLAQKYNDAIASARRFITIHPGNAEAPYAQYLLAMSFYQQIEDVSRDQATTQSAADAFGELIRRYPETRYAADARLKLDLINDHLAGKQMEIGRFYERSGQWLASTYYFRDVVEKYQTSSHTAEALERLVEANLALGLPEEAWKSAAVLGRNYPDTFWYRQSLRLLMKERQHTGMWTASGPAAMREDQAASYDRGSATAYPDRNAAAYPDKAAQPPKAQKPPKPKTNPTSYPQPGTKE